MKVKSLSMMNVHSNNGVTLVSTKTAPEHPSVANPNRESCIVEVVIVLVKNT